MLLLMLELNTNLLNAHCADDSKREKMVIVRDEECGMQKAANKILSRGFYCEWVGGWVVVEIVWFPSSSCWRCRWGFGGVDVDDD